MSHHRWTEERPAVRVRTQRCPAPLSDPLAGYATLARRFGRDDVYLLESADGPERDCRYSFLGFRELLTVSVLRQVVRVRGETELRDAAIERLLPMLDAVDGELHLRAPKQLWDVLRELHELFDAEGSASGFSFGFLGFFGYDAARYIEDLPYLIDEDPDVPDVQLVLYQGCVLQDVRDGTAELIVHQSDHWPDLDPQDLLDALSGDAVQHDDIDLPGAESSDDTERTDYLGHVERCLGHIAIGDIYQVQIGHELTIQSSAEPRRVYRRLRERNASPYMYLAPLAGQTVVGASPELFVRVEDGEVTMRPIAGTVPRGTGDDEAAAGKLRSDPKEIAEHVMLVDLCRNDIGRICVKDSLDVRDEMVVERYSHVLHLVSTVVGEAAPDVDSYDVIAALFPAGTMTGAPKIRAMEIIESIESRRRGLYAGALGLIDVGGYVNLALCIRTLLHRGDTYRTRASAGVVADSDAGREWTETLAKSSAAYWAVTGKELL